MTPATGRQRAAPDDAPPTTSRRSKPPTDPEPFRRASKAAWNIFAVLLCGLLLSGTASLLRADGIIDYIDPTYGGKVRELLKSDGDEHNIYYHRNPFNADHSYMIGIQSDLSGNNWEVVLYDGDGVLIKTLFSIAQYDWRLVWDRNDPATLYTWKGANLYQYNVNTGEAVVLTNFGSVNVNVGGPSLNQAGDRIMVITTDDVFHNFHLPDMSGEQKFKVTFPAGFSTDWEDERYIGFSNYIVTGCANSNASQANTYIYNDNGTLFHEFDGLNFGHSDFSPDGRWAYFKWPTGRPLSPLEVHVVNIDGTGDTLVYSLPGGQTETGARNVHLSWPDHVTNWFIGGFEPNASPPANYSAPQDEIFMVRQSGGAWIWDYLARSGTLLSAGFDQFWSEPLPSPSADGSRISFNSSRSGTVDQYILYPLFITTGLSLPGGIINNPYSQTLAGAGGTPPYNWTSTNGTLPSGWTLSTNGVLSGTPTAAGAFTFTVRINDQNGVVFSEDMNLAVSGQMQILSVTNLGAKGVQFTWTAAAGASYQVQYSADLVTWHNAGPPIVAGGNTAQFTDDGTGTGGQPAGSSQRFYRISTSNP
jgi:hypothetical protein